jgi:O-antigen/teichoic acid export membrane protein
VHLRWLVVAAIGAVLLAAPQTAAGAPGSAAAAPDAAPARTLRVALLGLQPSGPTAVRLILDPLVTLTPQLDQADVVVAYVGSAAHAAAALDAARAGRGAILMLTPGADPDLGALSALGARILGPRLEAASVAQPTGSSWIAREVAWNSAPEVRRRVALAPSSLETLVATRDGVPLILAGRLGSGRVIIVGADLETTPGTTPAEPTERECNASLHRWGYYAYLLRGLVAQAAGREPPSFASWPASPVPHAASFVLWAAVALVLWAAALVGFAFARRRGRASPDAGARFMAAVARAGAGTADGAGAAGAGAGDGARRERDLAWNRVGFARPLSAFLLFMAIMLLAFAPYVVLTTVVMGNYVQPFPEAEGLWRPLLEAAMFFWALFDMGTQTAFVKYFAEYRAKDATEAVRCVQFYFWWQVFSRLLQLTIVCAIAGALPRTQYALFSHFLALYGLMQLPGLVVGVKFMIQAVQRFDLQLTLDLLDQRIAVYLVPIPFVVLLRAWGRAHPEYGEAFGAALGLATGPQAAAVLVAVVGLYFLKVRLRLPLRPLLLAQFGWPTARRLLAFGFKATLGQEPYRIANLVENAIIVTRLQAWQTWLGLRAVLTNLTQNLVLFAWPYFSSAVPAFSEAYAADKKQLTQYYLVRYLQFAHIFVAVLVALIAAIGAPLVRDVMAPQWGRAGDYLLLALGVLVFLPFAWISDMLQQGSGRTGLNAIVMLIEQAVRVVLFVVLIPTLQFPGMYLAIILTIALKCVIAWTLNHLLIVRVRIYFWQMVAAPALASLCLYGLLRAVLALGVWHGFWPVLLLFFFATPVSLLLGFLLTGLAGGFDDAAMAELEDAAAMSAGLRRLTRLFAAAAKAGHRVAPLRNRFPVTLWAGAMAEARELEQAAATVAIAGSADEGDPATASPPPDRSDGAGSSGSR